MGTANLSPFWSGLVWTICIILCLAIVALFIITKRLFCTIAAIVIANHFRYSKNGK